VPVGFRVTDDAVDAPLGGDQLERGGVLAHLDSLVVVEMVQERPQDVRARRGVDVEDAVVGVGGLARVVERPVVALVEPHLEGVDEHVLDGVVGGFDEYIDGVGIGGAVAGVDDVPLEALGIPSSRRDTALCPVGAGAVGFRRFRQEKDFRALARGRECGRTTSDAAADDEHVRGLAVGRRLRPGVRLGHDQISSIRSSATPASSFSSGATPITLCSRPLTSSSSTHAR